MFNPLNRWAGKFLSLAIPCVLLLASCSDDSIPQAAENTSKGKNSIFNVGILKSIADVLDLDLHVYDGLLVGSIASSAQVHNQVDPLIVVTKPNAFFFDALLGRYVPMNDVRCNTTVLDYDNAVYPYRYRQGAGWNDEAYAYGDQLNWEFQTFEMEWVSESIDLPPSFNPVSVAAGDAIKFSEGATITWNNPRPDGDVMINLYTLDQSGIRGRYVLTELTVPDNGSYTFSTQDLQNFDVYDTGKLAFHLLRLNFKEKEYDNGAKKCAVLTVGEAYYLAPIQP